MTLFCRLHAAKVVQGSAYPRNVLVQPGPLTLPRASRSFAEPSFRIIDFGRAKCPGVNCTSIKELCAGEEECVREAYDSAPTTIGDVRNHAQHTT
jgi:hypothetical protein